MSEEEELVKAQEIIQVKTELHSLAKSFYSFVEEFKAYRERSEPSPIGIGGYLAIGLSILTILALLFGSVIYIINSANAPMNTSLSQLVVVSQNQQASIQGNTSFIQLTNKEVAGIKNMAKSNENTLEWLIFQENLPKQLTTLQEQVRELKDTSHLHPNMTKGL